MGSDRVGQLLGQAGFGVGIVAGPPDGYEEGMKGYLTGFRMSNRDPLAGEVHE